ncbi:pickpocket protein 19 [Scaptodrosophila lebanonensis]|uniref:Pickpocket protein 19 n=1 Tax=Drosophila lebanonensis TaxID=7225 RepID=A0A6J2T580_DROLE|nr:pickpocket protein 19 [Scaptodrosophila lebanonensis]
MAKLMLPYLKEYCDSSSLHGIRYLTDPKLQNFEKVIWVLLLIATTICATLVYIDLTERYNSVRIHTTIEDSMLPIFYSPFPSVGLCLRNRINLRKLQHEAVEHFLGTNASAADREIFVRFFTAASEVHLNRMYVMGKFFNNATLAMAVSRLDHLNVSEVLRYARLDCKDFFVECNWRGQSHNCCEIFEHERTEAGYCWVFNSAVSPKMRQRAKNDKYYPLHTPNSGEGTGLDVFMRLNKSLILPGVRGVYLMIKQPDQWSDEVRLVTHNTHTKISIVPRYTSTEQRTRSVTPTERHCIFDDETNDHRYKKLPGLKYWKGNCRSRCHQEHVDRLCRCTPMLLFPISDDDNFTDCKPSEFKCLYDNRDTFRVERHAMETLYVDSVYKDSMICDCLNSCVQLIFETVHSSTPLDFNETGVEMGTMRLDIFFQSSFFIKYQTRMRFTFVELLASFGGIIGLFLGASLLSAIELVYYFTMGLYFYLHGNWKLQQQQNSVQKLQHTQTIQPRPRVSKNKLVN